MTLHNYLFLMLQFQNLLGYLKNKSKYDLPKQKSVYNPELSIQLISIV